MMNKREKELAEWFFNLVGYFNHYSFFTKELWRKVKGFKNYDEAEIKCAFMHKWFHDKFKYFTCPVGMGWFCEVSEDSYRNYIKDFESVFDAFVKWKIEQR